jgi:hypothetical protein
MKPRRILGLFLTLPLAGCDPRRALRKDRAAYSDIQNLTDVLSPLVEGDIRNQGICCYPWWRNWEEGAADRRNRANRLPQSRLSDHSGNHRNESLMDVAE